MKITFKEIFSLRPFQFIVPPFMMALVLGGFLFQWAVVDHQPFQTLVGYVVAAVCIVVVGSFIFYVQAALFKKQASQKREQAIPTTSANVSMPQVKPPKVVEDGETTITVQGSLYSSMPQEVQCDKCGWMYTPLADGRFFRFCPGCGKQIRSDLIKGNDV
jgi:hypothetical protein